MSKYNVGLKTPLLQGLSEPEFYGDLVYKFRKIIGKNDFPYHFKKTIVRYKKVGYNIDVLRQTACLVVNPIKVNSFAYLFNCTTVGRASDWMRYHLKPYLRVTPAVGDWHPFRVVLGRAYRGLTGGFLLLRNFSVAISVSPHVCFILVLILISMFLR